MAVGLGVMRPWVLPPVLGSAALDALGNALTRYSVNGAGLRPLVQIAALYASETARAQEASRGKKTNEKVGVKQLADASDGSLSADQIRSALDDEKFPDALVRQAFLKEVVSPKPLEALLAETLRTKFSASSWEFVLLYALTENAEVPLAAGRYQEPSGADATQEAEEVRVVGDALRLMAAAWNLKLGSNELPVLISTQPDFGLLGENGQLRARLADWLPEYILEVGPWYNEVRPRAHPFGHQDHEWFFTVAQYLGWEPGELPPSPQPVRAARRLQAIEFEHLVAVPRADHQHYALCRPRISPGPPEVRGAQASARSRELAEMAGSLSNHSRGTGLRLQYFSHHNPIGWQRMFTVLCVLRALDAGLAP